MEQPNAVAEPSTPVTPVEANAPAAEQVTKPLSEEDRWNQGLKDLEGQKKPEVPKAEEAPKEETKTEEPAVEDDGFTEKVTFEGKEMGLKDLFDQAEFEVPFRGTTKSMDGQKLVQMASIGLAAAESNREAKNAVLEAQRVVKEMEASNSSALKAGIAEGVAKELERLLDAALSGTDPTTGRPFQSQQAMNETVGLLGSVKKLSREAPSQTPSLTRDEIEKMIEEKADKKFKDNQTRMQTERLVQDIKDSADSSLQKATEPLMQHFLLEDGKTLNTKLFEAFKREVKSEADQAWIEAGRPTDKAKISEAINKAAQATLKVYRGSLRGGPPKENKPIPPVTRTTSGTAPAAGPMKFKSAKEAEEYRWKQAIAAQQKGR